MKESMVPHTPGFSADRTVRQYTEQHYLQSAKSLIKMKRETKSEATTRAFYYNVSVASVRAASDYTPRVIADIPGASVPLESALILWHH